MYVYSLDLPPDSHHKQKQKCISPTGEFIFWVCRSILSGSRSPSRTDKRPLSSYRTVPDTYAASPLFVPSGAARLAKPVNVVQPIGGGGGFWPPPVVFPQRQATTPDPGKSEICLDDGMNFHTSEQSRNFLKNVKFAVVAVQIVNLLLHWLN